MDTSPDPKTESREGWAWSSLAASVLIPPLGTMLLFGFAGALSRESGRGMMQLFALAELGSIVGAIVGFAGSTQSSIWARTSRLIITILVGALGTYWLAALSGFAGMGP